MADEKTCKTCLWHIDFTGVCTNGSSARCADFAGDDCTCKHWEKREKCETCVMYQDGYCNRDGMYADDTKPSYSCRWWIGGKTMSEKLKRCPFCGGSVEIFANHHQQSDGKTRYYVKCSCGIETCEMESKEHVVKMWNRRYRNE